MGSPKAPLMGSGRLCLWGLFRLPQLELQTRSWKGELRGKALELPPEAPCPAAVASSSRQDFFGTPDPFRFHMLLSQVHFK